MGGASHSLGRVPLGGVRRRGVQPQFGSWTFGRGQEERRGQPPSSSCPNIAFGRGREGSERVRWGSEGKQGTGRFTRRFGREGGEVKGSKALGDSTRRFGREGRESGMWKEGRPMSGR